jgi:hypothetical protein
VLRLFFDQLRCLRVVDLSVLTRVEVAPTVERSSDRGTETSIMMLPESKTSYSQIISAPAAITPSSKSEPLISNMPMNRLSLIGSEISPSQSLNLMDPALPSSQGLLGLEGLLALLGQLISLAHQVVEDQRPPSLSRASTPTECDAGIASMLAAVLAMTILSSFRETGPPLESKTKT